MSDQQVSPEFKSFGEIKRLKKMTMSVTQKIHGTNAQVFIFKKEDGTLDLLVGSRTRWITPEKDNYGFAAHVYANKEAFLALGEGRHDGEWAGKGINSGEGMTERVFVLFDYWRYRDRPTLPPQTTIVPVLYEGSINLSQVDTCLEMLKDRGSFLFSGFMRPEGVVVNIAGTRYKVVFEEEETKWKDGDKIKSTLDKTTVPVDHLLQPIRLEKLLSRDETYLKEYPNNLPDIAKAYVEDLVKEEQIVGPEEDQKVIRKALGSPLFKFIRHTIDNLEYKNLIQG
jgi:RNA ligase